MNKGIQALNDGEQEETTLTYRITDGNGGFDTATVTVTVTGISAVNVPPVVNVGPDQEITLPVNFIDLNGVATDSDGSIGTYQWSQTGPSIASMDTPNASAISVTNMIAGTYVFRLTATDDDGAPGFDEVQVVVNAVQNNLPSAESFAISIDENSSNNPIDLSAHIDDPDVGDVLTTSITGLPANGTATISNNIISYTPATGYDGADSISYSVSDGKGGFAAGIVSIAVTNLNRPPVADARLLPDFDRRSLTRNFSGSGSSDPDGDSLTYQWSFRDFDNPINNSLGMDTPWSFTREGTYDVTLTVFDGKGGQDSDTITVDVDIANVLFSVEDGDFALTSLSVNDVSRQWTGRVRIYDEATSFILIVDDFLGTSTSFTIDGTQYTASAYIFGSGGEPVTTDIYQPGVYDYEFRVSISNPGFSGGGSVGVTND